MQTTTNNVEPFEAMKYFYELKNQYEEKYYEKYMQSIIKNKNKSKREKRVDFSKLPKPECISCNRNVGTIFSVKHHDNDPFRIFVAKCGDLSDPCPLDIHFEIYDRDTYERTIHETMKDLNNVKKEIIQEKNDVMFGYKHRTSTFGSSMDNKEVSLLKEVLTPDKINILLGPRSQQQDELMNKYKRKLGQGFIEILEGFNALSDEERSENKDTTQKVLENYISDKMRRAEAYTISGKDKVLHDFNVLSEKLKEQTELAGFFIESNMLKNDNPERANLLAKLEDEFGKEMLLPFKGILEEFMSTDNEQLVTKAVEMYKTEMLPKLKDIQQLRYDVNLVEFDPVTGQYFLTQRKNSMESLEFGPTTDDNVKTFVKTGVAMKKTKGKTLKKAGQEDKPKTKTRKLKPKIIVQEEAEPEELQD